MVWEYQETLFPLSVLLRATPIGARQDTFRILAIDRFNNRVKNNDMSLGAKIMDEMKTAMKAKDTVALEALRAIKSEILLAQTSAGGGDLTEEDEIKLLQKLVKQRKDSAAIFNEQNRADLAEPELAQVAVIEKFLPAQLSEAEVEVIIAEIIASTGANGMAAMGQVMGQASKELAGQADGKTISTIVKKLLA